jgi:hypothetical protein
LPAKRAATVRAAAEITQAERPCRAFPPHPQNEEFYEVHAESGQLPALNRQLRSWEKTYNCIRPHQSLTYLTPLEFITRWKENLRKAKCH